MIKRLVAVSALAAAPAAFALEPATVDAYYVPYSKLKVELPGGYDHYDEATGVGAKAFLPLGESRRFVVTGEYQYDRYDDGFLSDTSVKQGRVGGGMQFPIAGSDRWAAGVYGEYIHASVDPDISADGYGAHGRLSANFSDKFTTYAQAGYVSLSDSGRDYDGGEYLFGVSYQLYPRVGLFADVRYSDLSGGGDHTLDLTDVRTGVRYYFNG